MALQDIEIIDDTVVLHAREAHNYPAGEADDVVVPDTLEFRVCRTCFCPSGATRYSFNDVSGKIPRFYLDLFPDQDMEKELRRAGIVSNNVVLWADPLGWN